MRGSCSWIACAATGALAALLGGTAPSAQAAPVRAEPFTLGNGLEVFLRPIAGATNVALVLVLRVGGDHDPDGKSGLAHLVEHLYVTAAAGATTARTYADLVARYPAGHTAQTADRHTIVAQVFPAERLDEELADAAARLGGLTIAMEDLAREKPRVLEEVENMFERLPALAAQNRARERVHPHPAGGRRAGAPEHVRNLTLEDVRAFAAKHYRAGNAVLALAGALDAPAVKARVAARFRPLPRGEPPPAPPAREARSAAPDLYEGEFASGATSGPGHACVAYAAPPPTSPDYAAFLLFAARLLEARIAREGFHPPVAFAPLDEPGALYLSAPLGAQQTAGAAVAALHVYVTEAVGRPWSPTDATRVEQAYGLLLGLTNPGDARLAANPYAVALGLAARRVLGIDPEALERALDALKTAPLAATGARLFDPLAAGAAVLRARK